MCVCVFMRMCVCMCVHAYRHTYIHTSTYIHTRVYVYVYIHVSIRVFTPACALYMKNITVVKLLSVSYLQRMHMRTCVYKYTHTQVYAWEKYQWTITYTLYSNAIDARVRIHSCMRTSRRMYSEDFPVT